MEDEEKIAKGFDRGLEFEEIKEKLIKHLDRLYKRLQNADSVYKNKINIHKLCYTMIAMIQLKNGSRISEASRAFIKFCNSDDLDEKVVVKIAKSTGKQFSHTQKKLIDKKIRFRKMVFPEWIDRDIFDEIKDTKFMKLLINIKADRLMQRVLDYMLMYFNCNTHSLRYACINYLLTEKKIPMPTVAKYVGHINVNQLCTYTQQKEIDKVFDLDI